MEAEIARLSQQSVDLNGKLSPFPLLMFFCCIGPYCVLPAESLAQARRERDDVTLQSAELKKKLDSAEGDARAHADKAVQVARKEAKNARRRSPVDLEL